MQFKDAKSCTCSTCKAMCQVPCWGTPEDIQKLIDAGYAKKLCIDQWELPWNEEEDYRPSIDVLCPAQQGTHGWYMDYWRKGGNCVLHTKEGLCELHDLGLKPVEGRVATCGIRTDLPKPFRKWIADQWNTEVGQNLIAQWKEIVGFGE